MTPVELLAELGRWDITLTARGDRLVVDAPKGVLTPELRRGLLQSKAGLLQLLQKQTLSVLGAEDEKAQQLEEAQPESKTLWPPECYEAELRYGAPHARLYPLIGKCVVTTKGPGRLFNVISAPWGPLAGVILQGTDEVTHLRATEVLGADER